MLKPYTQKKLIEAGCDEAGRGCLAGAVFAAAVILPKNYRNKLLNDSKKIKEADRNFLRTEIEATAIAWSVAQCTAQEIDEINILNASFLAMHRAIKNLHTQPQLLLIDGNRFKKFVGISHQCYVKGDGIYASIAAASILAKTHRDEYMLQLHNEFPHYNWNKNKAYATPSHIKALKEFGQSQYHRKTFHLKPKQLVMEFEGNVNMG
jgi:ribonuclease HII